MISLFGKKKKKEIDTPAAPPVDIHWARTPKGKFHNLLKMDPVVEGLSRTAGIFVVWHGGTQPRWVYIAASDDLAEDIENASDDDRILEYLQHGGLYVTWSPVRPEYQPGVLRYLNDVMQPVIPNPAVNELDADPERSRPIAVFVPGGEPAGKKAQSQTEPKAEAPAATTKAPAAPFAPSGTGGSEKKLTLED